MLLLIILSLNRACLVLSKKNSEICMRKNVTNKFVEFNVESTAIKMVLRI